MFENMTGAVGFAMHEDRLAQATRNLRIMEAEATASKSRRSAGTTYRAAVAKSLTALAARIAPTVALANAGSAALTR
jgi:hypothetical protein